MTDWFENGLRFKCKGCECGDCCSGKHGPGTVWVSDEEVARLAAHVGMEAAAFRERYTRVVDGRVSLVERVNDDCIFYREGTGCLVYEARPVQCRTYPFWGKILRGPRTWSEEAKKCPGIHEDADVVPAEAIRAVLEEDEKSSRPRKV